jgi:hypothetical protein
VVLHVGLIQGFGGWPDDPFTMPQSFTVGLNRSLELLVGLGVASDVHKASKAAKYRSRDWLAM